VLTFRNVHNWGMGYLQPLTGGLETLDACIKELIAPKVLGRDASEVEVIWQSLWKSTYWLGRGGIALFAISALDIALWDIMGKRAGMPLFRLWGAAHKAVPAYGSGCFRGYGRDGMIAKAKSGRYSHFEVQRGMPINMLLEHFKRVGDMWEIPGAIRRAVAFPIHNPPHDPPGPGALRPIPPRNPATPFPGAP